VRSTHQQPHTLLILRIDIQLKLTGKPGCLATGTQA
jgi:hypothetical protein